MDSKTVISELRSLGWTQSAIADATDVTQGAISHIETGKRKETRLSTHQKLMAALKRARASEARKSKESDRAEA